MHIPSFGFLIHRTLLSKVNIVCLLPTRLQDDAQKKGRFVSDGGVMRTERAYPKEILEMREMNGMYPTERRDIQKRNGTTEQRFHLFKATTREARKVRDLRLRATRYAQKKGGLPQRRWCTHPEDDAISMWFPGFR